MRHIVAESCDDGATRHPVGTLRLHWTVATALALVALAALSIAVRPLLPVDETRYATVAWEMWVHGSAWLPLLNGEAYDHKPPALFWLIHLGWSIGGVNAIAPRLIGPLSTFVSLLLLARLGRRLWPALPAVGPLGSVVFLGCAFAAAYSTLLMFDMPLLACVIVAWIGTWGAGTRGRRRDWALVGVGVGAGLLVKGPVVLLYALPALVLMPLWRPRRSARIDASGPCLALALAVTPAALWLLLVAHDGNADYLQRLVVDQTVQRVASALGHQRPFWWYLPFVLLLPMPWPLWPGFWRALAALRAHRREPGTRFVALTLAAAFVLLGVIHGKQVHYLMPLLALLALLVARGLGGADATRAPWIAAASVAAVGAALWIGAPRLASRYALSEAADHVSQAQADGRAVAFVGKYQGEFGFLGRLTAPIAELRPADATAWAATHPDGLLVVRSKRIALVGAPRVEFRQPYKSDELLMLSGRALLDSRSTLHDAAPTPPAAPATDGSGRHG